MPASDEGPDLELCGSTLAPKLVWGESSTCCRSRPNSICFFLSLPVLRKRFTAIASHSKAIQILACLRAPQTEPLGTARHTVAGLAFYPVLLVSPATPKLPNTPCPLPSLITHEKFHWSTLSTHLNEPKILLLFRSIASENDSIHTIVSKSYAFHSMDSILRIPYKRALEMKACLSF